MKNKHNNSMMEFAPALGLVFGSGFGIIVGILTNNNLALAAIIGASLGLVIGSIVYANYKNKQ